MSPLSIHTAVAFTGSNLAGLPRTARSEPGTLSTVKNTFHDLNNPSAANRNSDARPSLPSYNSCGWTERGVLRCMETRGRLLVLCELATVAMILGAAKNGKTLQNHEECVGLMDGENRRGESCTATK